MFFSVQLNTCSFWGEGVLCAFYSGVLCSYERPVWLVMFYI
jgi:hypothetical protein